MIDDGVPETVVKVKRAYKRKVKPEVPPKPPSLAAYAIETSANGKFWHLHAIFDDLAEARTTAKEIVGAHCFQGVTQARVIVHREPLFMYEAAATVSETSVV